MRADMELRQLRYFVAVHTEGTLRGLPRNLILLNQHSHSKSNSRCLPLLQPHNRQQNEHTSNPTRGTDGGVAPTLLTSLEWRSIGPYRGGRVVAVTADMQHSQVFYFGSTGGGVWKTTDGGIFWENISDGFFKLASVCAIAVAPSYSNVFCVGMCESTIHCNFSNG